MHATSVFKINKNLDSYKALDLIILLRIFRHCNHSSIFEIWKKQEIGRWKQGNRRSTHIFISHSTWTILETQGKASNNDCVSGFFFFFWFLSICFFVYFVLYFYFRILGVKYPVSGHVWNVLNWFINIRNIVFLCEGDNEFSFHSHSLVTETKCCS